MPDEPKEGGQEVKEGAGQPAPSLSGPSDDKQPSAASGETERALARIAERLETLEASLQDRVQREVQSVKDRRLGRQEQEIAEIKRYLDDAKGDISKAARERAVDSILQRGLDPVERGGSDWVREWQEGSERILRSALDDFGVSIDRNDPDFQAVQGGTYGSAAEAYAALNRVVARRVKGEAPAAAAAGEGAGRAASPEPDVSALTNQLQEARLRNDWAKVAELKEALKPLL